MAWLCPTHGRPPLEQPLRPHRTRLSGLREGLDHGDWHSPSRRSPRPPPRPRHAAPTRRLRSPGDPQLRRAQALRRAAALVRPRLATSRGRCTAISTRPAWQGAQGHCWWHRLARAEGAARCGQRFHFVFSCHCLCLTRVEPGLLSRARGLCWEERTGPKSLRRVLPTTCDRRGADGMDGQRGPSWAPAREPRRPRPSRLLPPRASPGRPPPDTAGPGRGPTLLKRTRSFYKE